MTAPRTDDIDQMVQGYWPPEAAARMAICLALQHENVSRAELARRVGITPKHVSQVLLGNSRLSFDLAEFMMGALGWQLTIGARRAVTR